MTPLCLDCQVGPLDLIIVNFFGALGLVLIGSVFALGLVFYLRILSEQPATLTVSNGSGNPRQDRPKNYDRERLVACRQSPCTACGECQVVLDD